MTVGTFEQSRLVICEEGTEALGIGSAFMVLCRLLGPPPTKVGSRNKKILVRIVLGKSIICFNIAFRSFGVNDLAKLPTLHGLALTLLILLPNPSPSI